MFLYQPRLNALIVKGENCQNTVEENRPPHLRISREESLLGLVRKVDHVNVYYTPIFYFIDVNLYY